MVKTYNMSLLAEILSSKVREGLFQNLFDGRVVELHMRELERRTGCAIGTIQTELKKLSRLDLVCSRRDGNRLYYSAKREHPLYQDICSMVRKTVGITGLLKDSIAECEDIEYAFIFGSMTEDEQGAESDIDLMVIGTIGLRSLSGLLVAVTEATGREINPHVLSANELKKRVEAQEHFISNVMNTSKTFIKGGENDFKRLAGQRLAMEP